jgi:hypothetical protein
MAANGWVRLRTPIRRHFGSGSRNSSSSLSAVDVTMRPSSRTCKDSIQWFWCSAVVTAPRTADGPIVGIFLGHEAHSRQRLCSASDVGSAMDPKFEFLLKLRVFVLVAASGAFLVALQMSGMSRDVGIWIWAAGTVILIGLTFGPPLAKLVGGRRALVFGAILLGLGAAMYLYMVYVVIPDAIERVNAEGNTHQSPQPR